LPLWHGLAGVDTNAYYYEQITDDSGSGATLGAFRAKTAGLGPALSFVYNVAGHDTVGELKWLHETQAGNRLQGNEGWLKAVYEFPFPDARPAHRAALCAGPALMYATGGRHDDRPDPA
jgi:hypothetical protein